EAHRLRADDSDTGRDLRSELGHPDRRGIGLARRAVAHGVLQRSGVRQPFTAPAVMPDTIWRWKKMNRMRGGMVMSNTSANSRFQRELNWLWKSNSVS